ncbi:MAG TPA: M1 family metallopeptidase [Symbiobacteriaceae bacterium]|nr:M1 family metallopeptidase [Symbiobacteriaceae bacterium]
MRRLFAALLIVALLLSACSKSTRAVTWTGGALAGATFGLREAAGVTVHYALPTSPQTAEEVLGIAAPLVQNQVRWGRLVATDRVHIWMVPAGQAWPAALAAPPPGRRVRAAAPLSVVVAATDHDFSGISEAIAVAATQGAGSPVFAVDWLHEGTGGALALDQTQHPGPNLKRAVGRVPADMLKALNSGSGSEEYRASAIALATLVMDRWGVAWGSQARRSPEELTPEAALLWATGAGSEAEAVALWQERVNMAVVATQTGLTAMADMSPVRVEPKLAALPPGPGPNPNYSSQWYRIEARVEPDQRRVLGEEQLTWQNGEGIPVDTLYFNLWPNAEQYTRYGAAMTIESVTVDGKAAAFTARGLDLVVPLGRTVAPGAGAEVGIKFVTRMPATITPRVLGQAAQPDRFHLAHWFPILAVLDDRGWNLHAFPEFPGEPYSENASFRVKLDVPAGMVVAATGHPLGRTVQGDRWLYEWDAPNVKDWIAAAGRGFALPERKVGETTIRVLDQDEKAALALLDETERAFRLFEPQFGKYTYQDLVVVPCCAWVEYPGLFYTETPNSQRGNWWHTVLYHELAHQWFYGMVGNDQYSEAWLDEGFARYGERFGARAFGFTDQLRDIHAREIPPQVSVNSSTVRFNIYGGYTPAVYDLGAVLLEDLEARIGPERFRQLLNRWTETFRFKTATTADFLQLAEQVAGEDLQAFFRAHKIDPGAREPYRPVIPLGRVQPR